MAHVIVSIAGSRASEFAEVARYLVQSPAFAAVAAIEVNISCPNVANRGLVFACDPGSSSKVLTLVREEVPRGIPLLAKLSPDVTDIVLIAQACLKSGAHGLTMINTLLGMRIDTDAMAPMASPAACPARRSDRSPCAPSGR